MEKTLNHFSLHEGLPSSEIIESFSDGHHNVIILDDLMSELVKNSEMEKLFTQGCHHLKLSLVIISHNIFHQGKCSRTIALNTSYLVLFKNPRDSQQLSHLGRQIFGNKAIGFLEAYADVHKEPYSYLLVDITPYIRDEFRLRSHIFSDECVTLYKL